MAKSSTFQGSFDRFNGVTVKSWEQDCDTSSFVQRLKESLSEWKKSRVRGIWFHVSLAQAEWMSVLVENDFKLHHAKPEYVALYKWLPSDEKDLVPPFAHTMVGVGALVVNDADEILVVQEKYISEPHWKLPGGYVEPGEDLAEAAVREVTEETGIRTEFDSVIAFRHGREGYNYGCADFYFITRLKPLSSEVVASSEEIQQCKWMPLKEYITHPNVHDMNRYYAQKFLENNSRKVTIMPKDAMLSGSNRKFKLYSIESTVD